MSKQEQNNKEQILNLMLNRLSENCVKTISVPKLTNKKVIILDGRKYQV